MLTSDLALAKVCRVWRAFFYRSVRPFDVVDLYPVINDPLRKNKIDIHSAKINVISRSLFMLDMVAIQ